MLVTCIGLSVVVSLFNVTCGVWVVVVGLNGFVIVNVLLMGVVLVLEHLIC